MGGAGADSASSSDSLSSLSAVIHDHWCFGRFGESTFSSSSSSSTLVSWEDTALSSIPGERAVGESEIATSPSTSVPNDLSASGGSSEGDASTRIEPYVRVTRFFVETIGDDKGGDEEVGGTVLGESFKEVIGNAPFRVSVWNAPASRRLPIVDGHSRMSQRCDIFHVIALVAALNSPVASSLAP